MSQTTELFFDGVDDYIELPASSIPEGKAITISFWAKGGDLQPKNNSVIYAGTPSAAKIRIINVCLPWSDGSIYWDSGSDGTGFNRLYKQGTPNDWKGTWVHWGFTLDANTGDTAIYKDGALWAEAHNQKLPIPKVDYLRLGASYGPYDFYYNGSLSDLRVWDRALTAAEIKESMSSRLTGQEPGLVSYWPLDEGAGTTVTDRTGCSNNGTIHGGTWQPSDLQLTPAQQPGLLKQGPEGSTTPGTPFDFRPPENVQRPKLREFNLSHAWAINNIQVGYDTSDSASSFNGKFVIEPGDYLTKITGGWGRQAPGYPDDEIITLQLHTHNGVTSQVFGGGSGQSQTRPFSLEAPTGQEIIGCFGIRGGRQNLLLSLGVYLQPVLNVAISNIEYKGAVKRTQSDEYIEITNQGNGTVDISGWKVTSGGQDKGFVFPAGTSLVAGKSFRVYTNEVHEESGGFSFGSKTAIWNDKGDTGKLFDAEGNEVSSYSYEGQ
ncbi:lamin tail domain-containing protein [Roseofilum casamattae]|uniref:Lamin tail domain-containing protein n=1 Tax=Roseofilum casamattae BLCC-M143 TaxID=3022442 RepID=A0ABT7BZY2_9CYAN|nr:lamin tail domain-containing protein [Roseofilum casamattae]MDJ1184773.1 lamin tail domain-containing protein [Roseofilum casamattae BLCC-M143]